MRSLRIVTWNTKQGVASRQKASALWEWIARVTDADILVLTEAKPPKEGIPVGWNAIYIASGIDKRRPYSTIIASRTAELRRMEFNRRKTRREVNRPNPVTTFAVDVFVAGEVFLRVLGAYGLLSGTSNGLLELGKVVNEARDVLRQHGSQRFVLAGDFNLWSLNLFPKVKKLNLVDVTSCRTDLPNLEAPAGGSRIWTHKNGQACGNGARQELDYILVSKDLKSALSDIRGGVHDFPNAWEMSDHAPVGVTIRL